MTDHQDHDEDDLRSALADGVPTPPPAPDRAAGARRFARRARRRRTTGVGVAAALAVAAAVSMPALVNGGDAPPAQTTAASSPVAPVSIDCPAFDPGAGSQGPTEIGAEVTGARLCSEDDARSDLIPAEKAVELAALVDAQPAYDLDPVCPAEGGEQYLLVFARQDGSTHVVSGFTGGCGTVTVGGLERFGAAEVLDAARAASALQPAPDLACPDDSGTQPTSGPGEVAPGAVAVRLCQGPGLPFQPPHDLLSTDVDRVVELVNSRPVEQTDDNLCNFDLGTGYALVFGYPDGSTQRVTGELYGCHDLRVGGTVRTDPERVLTGFVSALRDQRSGTTPASGADTQLGCRGQSGSGVSTSLVGEPLDMTTAVLCVDRDRPTNPPGQVVEISDEDLATVIAGLRDGTQGDRPDEPDCYTDEPGLTLVGATAWGDRVTLRAYCGQWELGTGQRRTEPTADAQAVLDGLLAQLDDPFPTVDASTSPEQVVATYVELHDRDADDLADDVWVEADGEGRADPGARIGFKANGRGVASQEAGWADAVALEGVYSEGTADGYDDATFVLVRQTADEPYRILRLDR